MSSAPPPTNDFARVDACLARFDLDGAMRALDDCARGPNPDTRRVAFVRASLLMQEGFGEQACELLKGLIVAAPGRREFWSTYLTALKATDVSAEAFVGAHRLYGAQFFDDEAEAAAPEPPRAAAPLRVGYLGADGHLAIPRFLGHLPRSRHRSIVLVRNEACAERLRRATPAFECLTLARDPDQACEQIRRAGIDVLIDLCGHGPGGALDVLARRPAPVAMTWLDYLATTGLAAIDHRITDWVADPPGNETLHVETLARLPFAAWCYEPHPQAPPLRESGGPLVLGSACIPLKMTDRTLALWRRALEALPQARFELVGFMSTASRERVLRALGPQVAERTTMHGRLPIADYLAVVDSFDVALDAVGFSGGTSTYDCLWQGVPVATLPGRLSHSRSSASILAHLGLSRCIAASEDDFVARAVALAEARAPGRRAELRERLRVNAACDPVKFAAGFDDLISEVWRNRAGAERAESLIERALQRPLDRELRRTLFRTLALAPAPQAV
jgi:predicted O-linked N-acetylglucosamine transferase (SPINDLY family)